MILPSGVEYEEQLGDPPLATSLLYPAEAEVVASAGQARRRDFTSVRRCARACLERLGLPPAAILPGPGGAPVWPDGVVGSMTHCEGYAAAAVASAERFSTIGIDGEPDAPLPDGVLEIVASPGERARLTMDRSVRHADRLLFSAKEAVYKAWFPLTGEWLEHTDVDLRLQPEGTFTALLPGDGLHVDGRRVDSLGGRWSATAGTMVTAVVLPRVPAGGPPPVP